MSIPENVRTALVVSLSLMAVCYAGSSSSAQPVPAASAKTTNRENMNTPLACMQKMTDGFLTSGTSVDEFTRRWQGKGGRQYQQNGRDFKNINPCPEFFVNVLYFVPFATADDASLEFQLREDANLQLSDLNANFGRNRRSVDVPKAEYFRISRANNQFDATIIAYFQEDQPVSHSKPVILVFQKEAR
ncbi:hypothetical protein [Massilia aquatica]|uniref:Secreted protein n=1 Tax=Massilia aquatica TaxID=2609000 RepID=A0ABX0MCU9_9BURK|nr:hypothetical protein [Massilia aquatica]NHZ42753.1 hypothetical protein [Massilia aquatica]